MEEVELKEGKRVIPKFNDHAGITLLVSNSTAPKSCR